jgi:hypothetical protein
MTNTAHCFSPNHLLKALAEVAYLAYTLIRNSLIPVCVCVEYSVSKSKSKSMGFWRMQRKPRRAQCSYMKWIFWLGKNDLEEQSLWS